MNTEAGIGHSVIIIMNTEADTTHFVIKIIMNTEADASHIVVKIIMNTEAGTSHFDKACAFQDQTNPNECDSNIYKDCYRQGETDTQKESERERERERDRKRNKQSDRQTQKTSLKNQNIVLRYKVNA